MAAGGRGSPGRDTADLVQTHGGTVEKDSFLLVSPPPHSWSLMNSDGCIAGIWLSWVMAADGLHFHKKEQLAPLRIDWNKNRLRLIKNTTLRALRAPAVVRLERQSENWQCRVSRGDVSYPRPIKWSAIYIYINKTFLAPKCWKTFTTVNSCCTRRKKSLNKLGWMWSEAAQTCKMKWGKKERRINK